MSEKSKSIRGELARIVPLAAIAIVLGITAEFIIAVRPVEPLDPPLPVVDARPLAAIEEADHEVALQVLRDLTTSAGPTGKPQARSEEARAALSILQGPVDADNKPIPGFGGFYEWNQTAYSHPVDDIEHALAAFQEESQRLRVAIGEARKSLGEAQLYAWLQRLRAFHADELFYSVGRESEFDKYARTGVPSEELKNLAGGLLELLHREGWVSPSGVRHVPTAILRVRYKLFWTSTLLALDSCDRGSAPECYALAGPNGTAGPLPLDPAELRSLLDFLLLHPIVRAEDGSDRAAAADRRRLIYLNRIAQLDAYADPPSGDAHVYSAGFPIDLARGAVLYRLGDYAEAEQVLRHARNTHTSDMRAWNWHLAALNKLRGED